MVSVLEMTPNSWKRNVSMNRLLVLVLMVAGVALPGFAKDAQDIEPKTALLNNSLKPLYRAVSEGEPEDTIVNQTLELALGLRFCSERHLSFEGTQIVSNKTTKYDFTKWQFTPEQVEAVVGKHDVPCRIKGTIIEVRRGELTPGMPYIVVKLQEITPGTAPDAGSGE